MTDAVNVSDLIRKRLKRQYRELRNDGGWRAVAALYDVPGEFRTNQKYVYDLAMNGVEPTKYTERGQEVRYRLGLDQRPKPAWLDLTVCLLRQRERGEAIKGAVFNRKGKVVGHD